MGYAEMLMDDAVQADRERLIADLAAHPGCQPEPRIASYSACSIRRPFTTRRWQCGLAEFRRTLRHDLRTPMNAIKGYGEMLREDAADRGATRWSPISTSSCGEATAARPDRWPGAFSGAILRHRMDGARHRAGAPARMVDDLLKAVRPIAAKEADRAAVQPSRILVVDDNASNRDLLSRRLLRQGHTVLQAEDGASALALVEKEAFDLVLLDLMMPGMSGYRGARRAQGRSATPAHPRHHDLGADELDSIVRCIEAGADDYLPSRSTRSCCAPASTRRSRRNICATASRRSSRRCGSKRSARSSCCSTFCRRRSSRG